MKYKVIGWESCSCGTYEEHSPITASVDKAVIEEIRRCDYCFGGGSHDDYCPVLNDGTIAVYSTRGWGGVMAKAHNINDDSGYAYMNFYMEEFIKPEAWKTPSDYPNDDDIVPQESLVETHTMHLSDDMFEKVKAGTKTVETRLFDEKRQLVDIGDFIEFVKQSDEKQRIRRRVIDLDISENFEERFAKVEYNDKKVNIVLRYDPISLGFDEDTTYEQAVENMYKYYNRKQEKKYGVISFILQKPFHTCRTALNVWTNASLFINQAEYCERAYKKGEDSSRVDELEEDFYVFEEKEREISEIVNDEDDVNVYRNRVVEIGYNVEYDVDVNVMIRKTLKNLWGKEKQLKDLREKYWMSMTLDIISLNVIDSEKPQQKLELDDDIKEFLDKSGVELKVQVFEG